MFQVQYTVCMTVGKTLKNVYKDKRFKTRSAAEAFIEKLQNMPVNYGDVQLIESDRVKA